MATSRTVNGPTPAGGVRSEAIFANDQGDLVEESVATRVEIIEYDKDGNVLARTYGTIGP